MSTYKPGYIEGKTKMSVYVDPDVHRALKVRAAETGESMGDIVERALRKELGMMIHWSQLTLFGRDTLTVETDYGCIEITGSSLAYVDFDHHRFWEERSPPCTWPQDCYSEVTAAVAEALGADAVKDKTTDYGVRTLLIMPDGRERWLRADHEAIFWEE